MKIKDLEGKKILILGFGMEGRATLKYLKKVLSPEQVSKIGIADEKDGPGYLDKQKYYDLVIKTAGIPRRLVTKPYTTATNLFFANTTGKIIGITGSKGKSTTTSLIHSILHSAGKNEMLVGNIGRPMLEELTKPEGEGADRIYVCELSSYQCEDLEYSPHIAVYVSFFPDHMDYHGGLEQYWAAKNNLTAHSKAGDSVVYNPEYPRLADLAKELSERPESDRPQVLPFAHKLPFPQSAVPLLGKHNFDNVRGAYTVAKLLGISDEVIESAVRNFKALPHRLEPIGEFKGISFYDDAISTTPESTMAALDALSAGGRRIGAIFLGGKDRGYDFSGLAQKIVEKKVKVVVLFPESGAHIKEAILKVEGGASIKFHETRLMREAVEFAYAHADHGSVCLLSTASPSYSVWKNFEEKGDQFQKYAKELSA